MRARRRTSTSCSARTTCTAPRAAATRLGAERPAHRDPRGGRRRRPRDVPRRRSRPGARRRTTPGSRSRSAATTRCAFCIVPAVRGARSADRSTRSSTRSTQLAADGVTEVTLLGQNVNSYGRDLQLAARRRGDVRSSAPALRRPARARSARVEGIRRVRFTSPAPQRHAARDVRGDGRTRRRCASTSTTRCSPAATGCWRPCTAGTPPQRYLDRLADGPARVPDLAVSTDIIVGFPGETDDDFDARSRSSPRPQYDYAYMFIFSPRPGTEAAELHRQLRRPGRGRRALRAPARRRRARARWPSHEARVGRIEEVLVEGPSKKDPSVLTGRTRQNKLVHFAPPRRARRHLRHGRDHRAAPHHLVGPVRRAVGRATPQAARSPSLAGVTAHRRRRSCRADGVGQVDVAMAAAGAHAGHRVRAVDCDAGLPGHGHRHGQADARRSRGGAASLPRPRRSRRRLRGRRVPSAYAAALAGIEPRGASRPARRGYRPVPAARHRPPGVPGPVARRRPPTFEDEVDTSALHRSSASSTRSRRADGAGQRRRVVRALEVTLGSGRPFSSFGPGSHVSADRRDPVRPALAAPRLATRIEERVQR